MKNDDKVEEQENVRFFREGKEEYCAIIVPRDVAVHFIYCKYEL